MTFRTIAAGVRGRRLLLLRLLVYPYAVATLVLGPPGVDVTIWDWAVGLVCATLSLFGGRWPFGVLMVQSVILLYLRVNPGATAIGVVTPLVMVALVEVIARLNGRLITAGIVLADIAIMLIVSQSTGFAPLPLIVRMSIVVGGAALVGALIRSVRARIDEAEARAREAELRRESETRAVRAEERTAISRELHDLVAHHLSSIVLRTGVARHVAPSADPRLVAVLDDVHTDASSALTDLRQLVSVLRDPERVDEGPGAPLIDGADLQACIDEIAERTRQSGLSVVVRMDPDVAELDTVRRLAVLRLSQEGLTNALRHASGATRAELVIERGATGEVRVEVFDDGTTAGRRRSVDGGGHGIAGMRERVELVGGRFHAGPGDRGWRVTAELPPSPHADAVGAA